MSSESTKDAGSKSNMKPQLIVGALVLALFAFGIGRCTAGDEGEARASPRGSVAASSGCM